MIIITKLYTFQLSQQNKDLMLLVVDIFKISFLNLLFTVTFMLTLEEPPSFCALQVYPPSSLSVTFVKGRAVLASSDRRSPFLNQDSCVGREPSIILQVRLTLPPSSKMYWLAFGPNNSTFGRTTASKQLKRI